VNQAETFKLFELQEINGVVLPDFSFSEPNLAGELQTAQ